MLFCIKVEMSELDEPGRDSTDASLLSLRRYPEFFMRNGTDVGNGEIVSRCSVVSLESEESLEVGENRGRGTADTAVFPSEKDAFSVDDCSLASV